MIKIFIIDCNEIFREGLKRIIGRTSDMEIVGETVDTKEYLSQFKNGGIRAEILLMEFYLPGRSGIEVLKELKALEPESKVLIMSMLTDDQWALRALRAGASGYLTKRCTPEKLLEAIRKIHDGKRYISPDLAERLIDLIGDYSDLALHEKLSGREYQVFSMIAAGITTAEIARQLSRSTKTIGTFRARILKKMNLKSNAGIIHYAIEQHLPD